MSFYQLQVSKSFQDKWNNYLQLLRLTSKAIFFQNCTSILYDNIIKMKFPIQDNAEPLGDAFSYEEENAIRYVGGYVIAVLKKRHQSNKEIVMGLNHLTDNAISMPSAN